jgi:ABC-type polar amino acid transport system ATPase subunit
MLPSSFSPYILYCGSGVEQIEGVESQPGNRMEVFMQARDEVARPNALEVTPMVEIDGLNKWFGETHVLRDISMSVGRGEKIIICGPSGSGKSTLLRCIVGLEEAEKGRLAVDGVELGGNRRSIDQVRRCTGMVFRQFNLFPHLTVMGNLLLGPMCAEDAEREALEARAVELLERVGVADQGTKFPHDLSASQQQRVAIARALMREPKVLLFDEPTAALPPDMAGDVLGVIAGLAAEGMTMLAVTNEAGFARDVADLVVYMEGGEIVDAVPPSALFDAPADDLTRAFAGRALRH